MRSKEEILYSKNTKIENGVTTIYWPNDQEKLVEVLIDIRDLLKEKGKEI